MFCERLTMEYGGPLMSPRGLDGAGALSFFSKTPVPNDSQCRVRRAPRDFPLLAISSLLLLRIFFYLATESVRQERIFFSFG